MDEEGLGLLGDSMMGTCLAAMDYSFISTMSRWHSYVCEVDHDNTHLIPSQTKKKSQARCDKIVVTSAGLRLPQRRVLMIQNGPGASFHDRTT